MIHFRLLPLLAVLTLLPVVAGFGEPPRRPIPLPEDVRYGTAKIDYNTPENRLFVAFGSTPEKIGSKRVKGNGLLVLLVNRSAGKAVYRNEISEADNREIIVDYSDLASGILRVTQCTQDPREKDRWDVPFFLTTIATAKDGSCVTKERVLLKPEAGDRKEIEHFLDLALSSVGDNREFSDALAHLRNIGVARPSPVLIALKKAFAKSDGAAAEIVNLNPA